MNSDVDVDSAELLDEVVLGGEIQSTCKQSSPVCYVYHALSKKILYVSA